MEKWIIVGLFGIAVGLCFVASSYYLKKTEAMFNLKKVNVEAL